MDSVNLETNSENINIANTLTSSSSESSFDYNSEGSENSKYRESGYITTEDNNSEIAEPTPSSQLDPLDEQIICIELMNNNKIYLNYESHWTIRELFPHILNHKEFQKLYNNKDYSAANFLKNIFDIKLTIFRSIKEDTESKVDLDIKIADLAEIGLLKSHKSYNSHNSHNFPFLSLFDSRNFNKISKNEKMFKNIYDNKNTTIKDLDLIYRDYLPRNFISFQMRNNFPDVTQLYSYCKRSVNAFSKIMLDPILGDWFVYDDESLNFLMNAENLIDDSNNSANTNNSSSIKIINNKIFFQDKLPYMLLPNKEYKLIFLNIHINEEIKIKIDANLMSTPIELLKKINNKLKIPKPEASFDPCKKVLKVKGLCDYFNDPDSPIGLSAYITDCVKQDVIPEFVVIDSPLIEKINKTCNNSADRRRSSSLSEVSDLVGKVNTNVNVNGHNKNPIVSKTSNKLDNKFDNKTNLINNTNKFLKTTKTLQETKLKKEGGLDPLKNNIRHNKTITKEAKIIKEKNKSSKNFNLLNNKGDDSKENAPNSTNFTGPANKKENIFNIAVFNPDLINFTDLKGTRLRHTSTNANANANNIEEIKNNITGITQIADPPEEILFGFLNINEILKTSLQKKLLNKSEQIPNPNPNPNPNTTINSGTCTAPLDVDVDDLINERRRRTKGIRSDRSKTPVRVSGNTITRKHSVLVLEENATDNNINNHPNKNNNNKHAKVKEEPKLDLKLEEYITVMNSNIPILNIMRQFNIKLHMVRLKENFLKGIDLDKKVFDNNNNTNGTNTNNSSSSIINLEFKIQIFCGNEAISNSHKISWKGMGGGISTSLNLNDNENEITALINKRLFFDLKYRDLPLFSTIVFKIKANVKVTSNSKNKKNTNSENTNENSSKKTKTSTIAWINFKVFDHLKRMKTGMHRSSLWNSKFSDDSFFSKNDNYNKNTGEIFFELESFIRPVEHQSHTEEVNLFRPLITTISSKDQLIIDKISSKSSFEEISAEEKEVLWRNRNLLSEKPELITRVLLCVDKKNIRQIYELEKLILTCKPVPPIQALQLLSGNFLYDSIRKFAVYSLQQVSYLELTPLLPQLIQSIKYEVYHDSPLANFLLKLSVKYPLTIGHQMFWNLKAEMCDPNVQQRFGLYLEVFLNKIAPEVRKVFEDEVWFIEGLNKISDLNELEKFNAEFTQSGRLVSIPYNFKLRVKAIKTKKCKFMKSKKKPLWIVFQNADEEGDDIYVMFKKGDDLRQDVLTLQLFKIMQELWFKEGIKLKMSLYNVLSCGFYQGLLQIVTNSETLATIHKEFGGLTLGFSNKPLKNWMSKNITNITEKEYVNNFCISSAAYCVATFVLGIGDRHNDNIMLKKNGELFHIDFGHFLGHFKSKFGIKRERAPFVFTPEFLNVLGGEKSENFIKFKDICKKTYLILRKNAEVLITVLKTMSCVGIPELTNNSISKIFYLFLEFLEYSLALKMNDKEAEQFLIKKLDESLNSFSTKLNFAFHLLANK